MGKLFVIDAPDGAGKATQVARLEQRLVNEGYKVKVVSYPTYGKEHCVFVEMYLRGDFGKKPSDVSPKCASTFYALNRYADFMTDWKKDYEDGVIILADRYTTSNMIHQAAKFETNAEKEDFTTWVADYEYNILGIPKPTAVFYLDVAPEISAGLRENRMNKMDGTNTKDIHEADLAYMKASYDTALYLAKHQQWLPIQCVSNNTIESVDTIHEKIYQQLISLL